MLQRLPPVFRTGDLRSSNPARLASRLVAEGRAVKLANGLYAKRRASRFGSLPPSPSEVMRVFLQGREGRDWIFSGPEIWNALGLGSTAVFPETLVYNRKRTGSFRFGGMPFRLRRVAFPPRPRQEWFVVDLFQHAAEAGVDREELTQRLRAAVVEGRFDAERLLADAAEFGTKDTQARVARACAGTLT